MSDLENQLLAAVNKLQGEIDQIRAQPMRIPVVDADPPSTDNTNIWMFNDGRLRCRAPSGTIYEFAFTNHVHPSIVATPVGAPTTTITKPVPYVPTSRVWEQDCTWSTSYNKGGTGVRSTPHLYFGAYDSYNLENMSMIGFNAASARTALSGGRITRVRYRMSNIWANYNSGVQVRIGTHNVVSSPGTFSEVSYNVKTQAYGKPQNDVWCDLPVWVGEHIRDNTVQGITLHQATTDPAFYGFAAGLSDPQSAPHLRIEYVK